jgi:glycerophosphoryl diester phosphodiesterase
MPRVLRIGHRGAAGHAPENTLGAVEIGISLGVDFVEIDIQRSADGVLIALHDRTVSRTTDGKGRANALSLRELRALNAGNGERIPTVEEVLRLAAGRTGVMLELKAAGTARSTVESVQQAQFPNPVIYASFLHEELTDVRAAAPDAAVMVLLDRLPRSPVAYAARYGPTYVGLRHDRTNRSLVEAFQREHVLVCVYTANAPDDIQRVLSFGVDGVISDFPDRIPAQ